MKNGIQEQMFTLDKRQSPIFFAKLHLHLVGFAPINSAFIPLFIGEGIAIRAKSYSFVLQL